VNAGDTAMSVDLAETLGHAEADAEGLIRGKEWDPTQKKIEFFA